MAAKILNWAENRCTTGKTGTYDVMKVAITVNVTMQTSKNSMTLLNEK